MSESERIALDAALDRGVTGRPSHRPRAHAVAVISPMVADLPALAGGAHSAPPARRPATISTPSNAREVVGVLRDLRSKVFDPQAQLLPFERWPLGVRRADFIAQHREQRGQVA